MDAGVFSLFAAWITAHPAWAGSLVFLIAFFESLALVGLFMPGALLMFGVGALVGTGHLPLWPTLGAAFAGAVTGDGVSFWLGRHFNQRLKVMWPLRRHPELVARSTDFLHRHGGKSVLLGRFVGPIRPVIPAVAGMLGMPALRFAAVNVLSGALWAPAYLLPGVVFAASLGLAAEVASRLAVLIVLLLALLFTVVWLVRRLFRLLHPRAHALIRAVLAWARLHPRMATLPAAVLDPHHPEAKGLTLLALVLLGAGAAFFFILHGLSENTLLGGLDNTVYHALQSLRTPGVDRVMVAVTELGDGRLLTAVFTTVLLWLLSGRRWLAAGHWLAAAGFSLLLTAFLKVLTGVPRPTPLYVGWDAFSFPSGHVAHSLAVYGFLAVVIGREVSDAARALLYVFVGTLVALIGFSRLYLGAHWLSDVLGGLSLGLAWVALLGIAYRRHPSERLSPAGLALTAGLTVAVAGAWNITHHFRSDLARYAVRSETATMAADAWWQGGWRRLPAYRIDLADRHRYPLTLQYAGDLQRLRSHLAAEGWRAPVPLTATSWLRWFAATAALDQLPVLPQVHDGRYGSLLLVRAADEGRLLALRLWPANVRLTPGGEPVWVGNVTYLALRHPLGLLSFPRTLPRFDRPLVTVATELAGLEGRPVKRALNSKGWDGSLLLVR